MVDQVCRFSTQSYIVNAVAGFPVLLV